MNLGAEVNKVLNITDFTWIFITADTVLKLQQKLACVLALSLLSTSRATWLLSLSCVQRIIQTGRFSHL
jgi:hypothetical protein